MGITLSSLINQIKDHITQDQGTNFIIENNVIERGDWGVIVRRTSGASTAKIGQMSIAAVDGDVTVVRDYSLRFNIDDVLEEVFCFNLHEVLKF